MPCISYDFYELRRVMKSFEFYLFLFHCTTCEDILSWSEVVRASTGQNMRRESGKTMRMDVPGILLHFFPAVFSSLVGSNMQINAWSRVSDNPTYLRVEIFQKLTTSNTILSRSVQIPQADMREDVWHLWTQPQQNTSHYNPVIIEMEETGKEPRAVRKYQK